MDLHAQLLLRDPGLSANARSSATHIRDEARQLARMIVNLLDLSKGDEGKLLANRANLSLGPLVAAIVSELAANAQARNVSIETSVEVEAIYADPDLLRRLLSNLVENALRHAPAGTAVKVTISGLEETIELSVADSGPGVPTALRERIFDPFVQVEGSGRPETRAGRGLGLAFCRLAAVAHGGHIRVEDANPGAVFCVRLPRASSKTP
jgi:signal transduction histidine kinase